MGTSPTLPVYDDRPGEYRPVRGPEPAPRRDQRGRTADGSVRFFKNSASASPSWRAASTTQGGRGHQRRPALSGRRPDRSNERGRNPHATMGPAARPGGVRLTSTVGGCGESETKPPAPKARPERPQTARAIRPKVRDPPEPRRPGRDGNDHPGRPRSSSMDAGPAHRQVSERRLFAGSLG